MKKAASVLLIFCLLVLLSACTDPFSGKRPADYGNAVWMCEEYEASFCIDTSKDDYYDPEGEFKIGEETYFCKFYFIDQTDQLHISVYPIEYASLPDDSRNRDAVLASIKGRCEFSSSSLIFTVERITDNVLALDIERMTFKKSN